MKKLFLFFLIFYSTLSFAHDTKQSRYKFNLSMIQAVVRSALLKADTQIEELTLSGELTDIAELYFQSYLENIGAYNSVMPETIDIEEAYKTELANAYVLKEFKKTYPDLIYDDSKWMLNNVGGIFANMIILYCSPREYIVLWGTSLSADNKFSGYYPFMNEFDVMVRGEMTSHDVNAPGHVAVVYKPFIADGVRAKTADTSNLVPGNLRSYNLKQYTYMISYAQGSIVRAFMPGAIMPGIFVNQDWASLGAHIKESIKAYLHSIKKPEKKQIDFEREFQKNANYRAISIIDDYQAKAASYNHKY